MASDPFLHSWDERYHALVAKNLSYNFWVPTLYDTPILPYDYKDWTSNHIWMHKQPVPLWILSFSLQCFGLNEFALRLPSFILSSVSIFLIYYLAKHIFNVKVGLMAAYLFSVNGLILELGSGRTATDHIDLFFLFFILLAVVVAYHFSISKVKWHLIFCFT